MIKFLCTIVLISTSYLLTAQVEYEISKDPENQAVKVLRGTLNKYLLQNDTSFQWYTPNQKLYHPDKAIILSFAKVKELKLQLVIFGGTWCEDTQFILPKFFKLQELSGVPDENITFFGVNRKKLALGHISEAFGITNVPTIIVLKNGKELGRVVEYGKTGKWDVELAEIIDKN